MNLSTVLFIVSSVLTVLSLPDPLVVQVDPLLGNDTSECLQSSSTPCQTLLYALQEGAVKVASSTILLAKGDYNLTDIIYLFRKTRFELLGPPNDLSTIYCTEDDPDSPPGFLFDHSFNIKFQNVHLIGCGAEAISSSTYESGNSTHLSLPFKVALYFIFCANITFDHITVSDSTGVGVVFYSTVGSVRVTNSVFANNSYEEGFPGGGGVAVEFLYCIPGDTMCSDFKSSNIPSNYSNGSITQAYYHFEFCNFTDNSGNTNNITGDSFIVPHGSNNVALGRGGGLSVLYKGNVTNIPVTISNCVFNGNTAVWGGGMLIEFQDHSTDNDVRVEDCWVIGNQCPIDDPCAYKGTGGGGVRVQFASFENNVKRNNVIFLRVQFINNGAYFGGGLSLFTFPSYTLNDVNHLTFSSCKWSNNTARLGSAVDLSQWNVEGLGLGHVFLVPEFINCTFTDNNVHYTEHNYTGLPSGIGTLYTDTVPILLTGVNNFNDNYGSALVSLDAAITFGDNSQTFFYNNEGRVGGAVSLFNKAYLKLNVSSNLYFTDNVAYLFGGAIYWESLGDHQLLSSRNCFIRYYNTSTDPTNWDTFLRFTNNTARLEGDAIYGTSLLGCLWGGKSYSKLIDPKLQYENVFCWNTDTTTIWDYTPHQCSDTNIIASAPGYYAMSGNITEVKCGQDDYIFNVVPGKPQVLDVRMLDDRYKPLSPDSVVFSYHINNDSQNNITNYTTYENSTYYGQPGETAIMYMATIQPRVIATKVILNFTECPPGFVIDSNHCIRGNYPYIRIYSNFSADIQYGYWLGKGKDEQLYVSQCLFCTLDTDCNVNSDQINYRRLPDTVDELECMFCGGLNREGILCSDCRTGYCTAVNSPQYKCIQESTQPGHYHSYAWLFYILWEYVPITIMLLVVFLFNLSVTSGPANAFVFFAQVISTTFNVDADGQINNLSIAHSSPYFSQVYKFIYGMWNLDFLSAIKYDGWLFCLGPNITALHLVTLKYIAAIYPLIIILLIIFLVHLYNNNNRVIVHVFRPFHWLSARCLRRLNVERSLMDSLATFLILSYVKFAVTSCYLLYPNVLQGSNDNKLFVSYYDGNLEYKSLKYLPYILVSLLAVLWCILLPTILLFYSIRPCYLCLQRTGCRWLQPGPSLQHFLNSFHHCFKDGSSNGEHDRRYYSAIYFFLKFLLISTYAFGLDWTKQYIYQQIVCTLAILIVGTLQPYKKLLHNFLDMGMFSLLAVINILSVYNKYQQAVNYPLSKVTYYTQLILIFAPICYLVCYLIVLNVWPCVKRKKAGDQRELEFSFRHFMNDVEGENRLQANNYYGSIHEGDQRPPRVDTQVNDETIIEEQDLLGEPRHTIQSRRNKKKRFSTEPITRLFRRNN